MGYHTYAVREDNGTRFELGKLQYGLHRVFRDLEDERRRLVLTDPEILAEFILDQIIERPRFWQQPRDYIPYAAALAERLVRFGGGQPVVCVGENEFHGNRELARTTDSIHESEWPYYDVLQSLRPELWPQIEPWNYIPNAVPIVNYVKSFRLVNYKNLESDAERKAFLEEMSKLQPLTTNRDCGYLGCGVTGPHDHGFADPGREPPLLLYCGCNCHNNPVVCTGFHFCCHEVNTPQSKQTPRPPIENPVIGDFKTFKFPLIRSKFPKLFP